MAQFVARNGPEFEQMTKSKQKGNAKFQFLYGGEHFNYYQYKVTAEQASKFSCKGGFTELCPVVETLIPTLELYEQRQRMSKTLTF